MVLKNRMHHPAKIKTDIICHPCSSNYSLSFADFNDDRAVENLKEQEREEDQTSLNAHYMDQVDRSNPLSYCYPIMKKSNLEMTIAKLVEKLV